jgi:hypothetical protein
MADFPEQRTARPQGAAPPARRPAAGPAAWHFLRYNARICAGLGPWLLVVPVASTMLVLFALMAMTSLVREHLAVMVLELLGALVMAFVGTSLLRPEYQYNTLETVLTRPVSFRAIVGVRMALAGSGVLALQALMALYMNRVMGKQFSLPSALLAAAVSMAFLAALAVTVGAFSRSPTLGFLAAGAFWALDVVFVGQLNPVLLLAGYGMALKEPEGIFTAWILGKAVLVGLTLLLVYLAARAGARPAGQWNLRRVVRSAACVLAVALVYLGSGAVYKLRWGIAHEAELGNRIRPWYQQAFRCYGSVPVAPLLSPSFARFIGYRAPWTRLPKDPEGRLSDERYYQLEQLKIAALGSATGQWVDNGLYEVGRMLLSDYEQAPLGPQFRLGLKCLEQLTREHPGSLFAALGLERLAHAYWTVGDDPSAEAAVRKLVEQCPSTEAAFRAGRDFAAKLREQHRLEEAVAVLEPLAQNASASERPLVLLLLGDLLSDPEVQRPERAVTAYEEAERLCTQTLTELIGLEDANADQLRLLRDTGALRTQARERLAALRG